MLNLRRRAVVEFLLPGLLLGLFLGGCALPVPRSAQPRNGAFTAYWPPPAGSQKLRLAVKDNIDMQGLVTTAGSEYVAKHSRPAARDAACLAGARAAGVQFVGKTKLSEFAVSPSGINEYFGTPKNPLDRWWRRLIPGGSSSGSAQAVANGLADVAFGTDTAGSVRTPAACSGVVGLKTTFGLIPLKGVFPIEPWHLDTVGPMARDVAGAAQGMNLLQPGFAARYRAATAAQPTARTIKIGRLYLSGTDSQIDRAIDEALAQRHFQVTRLDPSFVAQWVQAEKDGVTVAASGAWLSEGQYAAQPGVSARGKTAILLGRVMYPVQYRQALQRRAQWQAALRKVFRQVDFIALPTIQRAPLKIPLIGTIGVLEPQVLALQNTVAVNFAGNPALALPVPVRHARVPVTSLQLIGPLLSEAQLLNAGRLLEARP